jgi:2-keto-3-deoxy-L-arabinonate dehydratase
LSAHAKPLAIKGVLPVAPTVFHDGGALDLDGQKRVIDCMVDQRVDAICILANFSEQFLLDDAERLRVLDVCIDHCAGRVPVIVTISHFSTDVAVARAKRAAKAGAAMVMMMPPYHGATLQADEDAMVEHFAAVAEGSGLPIMLQDAPLSGVKLSVGFLARLAREVPAVNHFKIETPFAAAKLRDLIAAGGPAIVGPLDGEESITLMADLDAGAVGTMSSATIPDLIRRVVDAYAKGERAAAAAAYRDILPLINFENRQCGLRAAKALMKEGAVIRSDFVRHPMRPLHPATRKGLLELAAELKPLALRWGK